MTTQRSSSPFEVLDRTLRDLSGVPAALTEIRALLTEGRVGEKRLLKVKEAAALASISERTMFDLIDRGEIPVRDIQGMRVTLIARSDLDAWIESLPRRERP